MAIIRRMKRAELDQLVSWAAIEGWNPGLHDAELFWNADPNGFLALELHGQLAGGGAIVRHNASYGFMGLFIVRPEFRGRGLGTELWYARRDQLRARLGSGGVIGLDAVDAMIPFYARGGFSVWTRHRRYRWDQPNLNDQSATEGLVTDLRTVDLSELLELDRVCFPGERAEFLQSWRNQPDSVAFGVVTEKGLRGMGVMRKCLEGWKIGPLFSRSPEVAQQLLTAFAARSGGAPILVDVPDNNPVAGELCRQFGMQEVFGCVRMYLGEPPRLQDSLIFGITTLETG